MSNIDTLSQFCRAVWDGKQPAETRCTAATPKEVLELLDYTSKAAPWFARKSIVAKSSGQGNIQENGFSFRAGAHTFTVLPPGKAKTKRPQAVTQTSREAYHSLDFTTQRGQIAQIIFNATMNCKGITRKEIEVFHGFGCNVVAGRVKELLEMSEQIPFVFGAHKYRLKVVGTRLSNCEGASNVPNEALVWMIEAGQSVVCSRMAKGQSSLFQ